MCQVFVYNSSCQCVRRMFVLSSHLSKYDEPFNGYAFSKIVHTERLAVADRDNFSRIACKIKRFFSKTYTNKTKG